MHDLFFKRYKLKTMYICKKKINKGHMKRMESNWGSWQKVTFGKENLRGFM